MAGRSVISGIAAAVIIVHFVERLYNDAVTPITHGAGDGGHAGAADRPEPHAH